MAALTVNINSWVTDAEARAFLDDRINVPDAYKADTVAGAALRKPNLITAYYDLELITVAITDIDDTGEVSEVDAGYIKRAQIEQSFYLFFTYGQDSEKRMAIQNQGVSEADYSKETYSEKKSAYARISPQAMKFLPSAYISKPPKGQPTHVR